MKRLMTFISSSFLRTDATFYSPNIHSMENGEGGGKTRFEVKKGILSSAQNKHSGVPRISFCGKSSTVLINQRDFDVTRLLGFKFPATLCSRQEVQWCVRCSQALPVPFILPLGVK